MSQPRMQGSNVDSTYKETAAWAKYSDIVVQRGLSFFYVHVWIACLIHDGMVALSIAKMKYLLSRGSSRYLKALWTY